MSQVVPQFSLEIKTLTFGIWLIPSSGLLSTHFVSSRFLFCEKSWHPLISNFHSCELLEVLFDKAKCGENKNIAKGRPDPSVDCFDQ